MMDPFAIAALVTAAGSLIIGVSGWRERRSKAKVDEASIEKTKVDLDKVKADLETTLWLRLKGELGELEKDLGAVKSQRDFALAKSESLLNQLEAALERADKLEQKLASLSVRVAALEAENLSLRQIILEK